MAPNGSREHIFDPLGMESCSFYLTPALKKRLVSLSVPADDNTLKRWEGEVQILEQDPEKGIYTIAFSSWSKYIHPLALVSLNLGGDGMYSSMRDYLKLLRNILQINGLMHIISFLTCANDLIVRTVAGQNLANPIFQRETIQQLFVPALTQKGSMSLSNFVMSPGAQWGIAAAITTKDRPQGRRKGSIWCML